MADLRLCNQLELRISLSFFERLGLALDRLKVTFLPADVRGSRHQFISRIAICALRAHTRLRPCEMCRRRAFSTGSTRHGRIRTMRHCTINARFCLAQPLMIQHKNRRSQAPIQLRDDQLVQTACRDVQGTFVLCHCQICLINEIPCIRREFRHNQR